VPKCDHQENCECEKIKKELSDTLKSNRSKSESRNFEKEEKELLELQRRNSEIQAPLSPLEVKQYNSKTLPKRIEKIKQKRAKKETARFYTDLGDDLPGADDTILKIVEASDSKAETNIEQEKNELIDDKTSISFSKKEDSEIIRSILEKPEFRKITKHGALRRQSLEQIERSPLTNRKLSEALAAIQLESSQKETKPLEIPISEPLYEELLRNVHVPYKFAPPIVKRSMSVSSSSSTKEAVSLAQSHAASTVTINDDEHDGSDCDYVTLTYSNEGLETIDGDYVGKNSSVKLNDTISCSDTNICYNKRNSISHLNCSGASSDDMKAEISTADSVNDLDRRDGLGARSRSFLHKFINKRSNDDDLSSQKSVAASITSSRKSFDGVLNYKPKNTPPVYRQGSEDLGNRIAHVDYADPKSLFPSAVNIFVNKNSLNQRDSVVSSSSDSVCDSQKQNKPQQQSEPFSDSFYEDTAESLLENDFRDSAIYSDDSNERKLESNAPLEEHIYASVSKPAITIRQTPPKIPKKPAIPLRTTKLANMQSPPPVPTKPSNLRTPEIRNAIFSVRKLHQSVDGNAMSPTSPTKASSPKSWVSEQVQKFQ
jgi:pleckstrin homology domain-containing family G member 1/2/3